MLDITGLWDTCQGDLQAWCGTSLGKEKTAAFKKAKRNWRSYECFDIRRGVSEFAQLVFTLALIQYFFTMLTPPALLEW